MATIYPDGQDPLIFAGTLPVGSTDTANAPLLAQQAHSLSTVTSASGGMTLSFVIFACPNANNGAGAPLQPLVEVQTGGGPWQLLQQTGGQGSNSLTLGPVANSELVDYLFGPPDGNGVSTIAFQQNNAPFGSQTWDIRFTVADGVTGTPALPQTGLTYVVDPDGALAPWLAVPGQQKNAAPPAFDFGAALAGLTLAGTTPGASKQLIANKTYPLSVPIGNYGPGPLTVSSVTAVGAAQAVTLTLAASIVIAPGATNPVALQASFVAPSGGQTAAPATLASFTLASSDPVAHYDAIAFNASAGNFEIMLALDMSGSMATNDAGGQTRWYQLEQATGQILSSIVAFAGPNDKLGAVLYPARGGASIGDVALPMGFATLAQATALTTVLSSAAAGPIDSTPMAGTAAAPGGIYTAAGLPNHSNIDCGQFANSIAPGFSRNFRWLIVMSDGMSNVGDDPRTLPSSYFKSRNIGVVSVGYGAAGAGEVGVDTLKAIANASVGGNLPNPPNYFGADQTSGLPSNQLIMGFEKAAASALGLSFAVDPDDILTAATPVKQHKVVVADYDRSASFLVCCGTVPEGRALYVELLSPLGERVNPTNATSFGMTFRETALSRHYHAPQDNLAGFRGSPARYGVWTIIVSSQVREFADLQPRSAASPGLRYAYSASLESDLSLTVLSREPQHFAGEPIDILAALSLRGRPLRSAQVTATVVGSGAGFANWLAAQPVSDAEYQAALNALAAKGLKDVQAIFVKTQALAAKGIFYPAAGANAVITLAFDPHSGLYRGEFSATVAPGTYQILVSAAGVDGGAPFTRQQTWTTAVTPKPDAHSTLVSIAYAFVAPNMTATLTVWPRDRFGNVFLVDPAISQAIQILLDGGATASGPLRWNLDGSYSLPFVYPATATPTISIQIVGDPTIPKIEPPQFSKMLFVDEVLRYAKGREARNGANAFTDPSKALGDPSRKPPSEFVALGGRGSAAFAHKGEPVKAKSVTVFVHLDKLLRRYAVEVLPAEIGAGWVEVGRSEGVTQTFGLTPKRHVPVDDKDWFIEVEGHLAGGTFEAKIPLEGKLKFRIDPLSRIGDKGIVAVRVVDLSDLVADPDGSPSPSPGVGVLAIGMTP